MSESGVIPPRGDRASRRPIAMIENDDGYLAIELRGSSIRVSGDMVLDRDYQEEFAVIYVRAVWEAGGNAEATMPP